MRRAFLQMVTVVFLLVISVTIGAAQKKSARQEKMRKVNIYLFRYADEDFPIMPVLITVKRQVSARAPLTGAIKALLGGATLREAKNNENSFIRGLELDSVSIKNNVARIDLKYDEENGNRDDPMMELLFPEAIKDTIMQFSNIKSFLVCVNGIENFYLYKDLQKKCPEREARGEE